MPKDHFGLLSQDANVFEYLYSQVSSRYRVSSIEYRGLLKGDQTDVFKLLAPSKQFSAKRYLIKRQNKKAHVPVIHFEVEIK